MLIGPPIPGIQLFQNLTLKIQGQGHGRGQSRKSQHGSNIQSTHIHFDVNRASHSWVMTFSKFDLENLASRSWMRLQFKSQCGSNILSTHIPFVPRQSALPFLRYSIFKIWPWKSRVKVKWPWCHTTTGLDNSRELQWYKFLAHGQDHLAQMGK